MARVLVAAVVLAMVGAAVADDVVKLTDRSFNKKVLGSDGVWMVEFYAPWCGHCKNLAPEWSKAATALKGVVNVAAVDATAETQLASKYQIQGFPTIKVFGLDKNSPTDYQGQRQAKAIVDAGLKEARNLVKARMGGKKGSKKSGRKSSGSSAGNDAVITLTDDNFDELVMNSKDMWMVEFYAPWCGHCKNLAPEWAQAASELDGQVKLGALDATAEQMLAQRYQIKGFPTIKVFLPGEKKQSEVQDYQGGRTSNAITSYALKTLEENGVEPEVHELTDQKVWDEHCSGKRICLVAVLPHILDSGAAGRNEYLDTLKAVMKKKMKLGFRFLWTSAGEQPGLERAMNLEFGFPAMTAVAPAKGLYAVHTGAFNEFKIGSFCESIMSGGAKLSTFKAPKVATVAPWDGKDGQAYEEDDDDADLMAELMAEL